MTWQDRDGSGTVRLPQPRRPVLFVVRPRDQARSGVRQAARGAAEAVRVARQMEERGLVVEILDPSGQIYSPAELDQVRSDRALSPDQVHLIQSTCDVLMSANTRAADVFYDRLFALAPDTRPMFEDDLSGQKRKLLDTLGSLVGYLTHPDLFGAAATELGRRHAGYGAEPAHYGLVGQALLASLEELLGRRFTPEVQAAWTALYGQLSRAMMQAQRRPAAS
ncbi:MAG: globin [Enterovirga sp.]|nr:globin [Enterovirga sp.]